MKHHKDGHHKDGHHKSKHHHDMRSPTMPKEHWESHGGDLDVNRMKYAGHDSMDNPEELTRASNELVKYMETHRAKH